MVGLHLYGQRQRSATHWRLSLMVVLLGMLLLFSSCISSATATEDDGSTITRNAIEDDETLQQQNVRRRELDFQNQVQSLDRTLENDLDDLKAWYERATDEERPELEQAIAETEHFLEQQKLDGYYNEEPTMRVLQTVGELDMTKERRVLFYGDNTVLGISGRDTYPPGQMLEDELVSMGWTGAKVTSVGLRQWSSSWMYNNLRQDKSGLLENIRRVGPEIVILSAGALDVFRGETDVAAVLNNFEVMRDRMFGPEAQGVRYLFILPIPAWDMSNERNDFRLALNQGLRDTFAPLFKRVTVLNPPFPYTSGSPYYDGNDFSETGYAQLASALATQVSTKFEEPLRLLCYGDSITVGTWSGGDPAPYSDALQETLAQEYGTHVQTIMYAFPAWRAISSAEGIYTHNLGLANILNFRVMSLAPIDMLVLLLGTNDIKFNADYLPVHQALATHHFVAYDELVRHSIAMEVPPSSFQATKPLQANNAALLKERQMTMVDDRITFFEWPFPYENFHNSELWSDGFHPTDIGYDIIGQSLAPVIWGVLEGTQRVFCYGDAWTSGKTGGTEALHPYAPELENLLRGDSSTGRNAVVGHLGFGERGALELAESSRGGASRYGLANQLAGAPEMDVVILWAGAYDLRSGDNGYQRVFRAIRAMNDIALYRGAKRTIIIGLPPPESEDRPLLREAVNDRLETYAAAKSETTYFRFPFNQYTPSARVWGPGGHLSRYGNLRLAALLHPVVDRLLGEVEPTPGRRAA